MTRPTPLSLRDITIRVTQSAPVEHYMEGRDRRGRAQRFIMDGVTFCIIEPQNIGALEVVVEVFATGWLYRIETKRDRVVQQAFVGDEDKCAEDLMLIRMKL